MRFPPSIITEGILKDDINQAKVRFDRTKGRAQRSLSQASVAALTALLQKSLDEKLGFVPFEKLSKPAAEVLCPSVYAITSSRITASFEANNLGTARLGFAGTREVVCMPGRKLLASLEAQMGKALDPKDVSNLAKAWTKVDAEKLIAGGVPLFHCTVGPQDALCLPPDFFFIEQTLSSDVFGMRFQSVNVSHLPVLDALNTDFLSKHKGGNPSLAAVLDCLTLYEPEPSS